MLSWDVTGEVTAVSIDQGIGAVQRAGNRTVSPDNSTVFALTASGPGGAARASTAIRVFSAPPSAPPASLPRTPPATLEGRLASDVQDAYFDYDKSDLRSDAQDTLARDATALRSILRDFPKLVLTLEGHCDERGSAEYNLALGDRRASAAKDFLVQFGVPANSLKVISFGKERQVCAEQSEACWQSNRRVHFSAGP